MRKKTLLISVCWILTCCAFANTTWTQIQEYLSNPQKISLSKELELKKQKKHFLKERNDNIENLIKALSDYLVGKNNEALHNFDKLNNDQYIKEIISEFIGMDLESLKFYCHENQILLSNPEDISNCPTCAGAGWQACGKCKGTGQSPLDGTCAQCHGWGIFKCSDCQGQGYLKNNMDIENLNDSIPEPMHIKINNLIQMANYLAQDGPDLFTEAGLRKAPRVSQHKD